MTLFDTDSHNFAAMKRLGILIAVLISALAAFFIFRKDLNHTGEIAAGDFALKYRPDIDKIFFASNDKTKGFLTFTKDQNQMWYVDNGKNKYPADTAFIIDLLRVVMPGLVVQNPVSDNSLDYINRKMSLSGVKVQFYSGNKELKTMYVGDRTADDLGTYMYLPGTKRPCIVKLPGHNGYLTPYFNTDIAAWRSLALIDVPAANIVSVKVDWPENPADGFTIYKNGDEPYMLDAGGNRVQANRNRMLAYLDMFTALTRESGEPAGINKTAQRDSILASRPFFSLEVRKKDKHTDILNLYRMKTSSETYSPENRIGELKVYETETYWGTLKGSGEIWVMQDAILKNRMKKRSDFLR